MSYITENYQQIADEVKSLSSDKTFLLPVSKTFPASDIKVLYDYGVREFAENRLQELEPKAKELPSDIRWHFIGHLQSNKVRKVVPLASVIHSVDSASLLDKIDRAATDFERHIDCFLEFKPAGEDSKTGADINAADEIFERARQCGKFCNVCGIMGMAPLGGTAEENRAAFRKLRELRNYAQEKFGLVLPQLSMGMSGDYKEAIAEASTIVRIGSAIFGKRNGCVIKDD